MFKNKKRTATVLPHLPKGGIAMPEVQVSHEPLMPGQKTLPQTDWRRDDDQQQDRNGDEGKQLVPGIQNQQQSMVLGHRRSAAKQGVPWTDKQSKTQMENSSSEPPPPMFSAAPNRSVSMRHPTSSRSQQRVYRMESGIDPVVLLSSRLEAWRLAVKSLVALFKKISAVEIKTAKGLIDSSREVIIPFRKSNGQFLESGGIQDVWSSIRDYTMQHGILHNEASKYTSTTVVPNLRAIKADIKSMIVSIEKDRGLKSNAIFDSRMNVDRLISRLDKVISSVSRSPESANQYTDPFLINLSIIHAVRELCDHENQLHDNILNLQKETGMFEQKVVENCRHVLIRLKEYRVKHQMESEDIIGQVVDTFEDIEPTSEWNNFIHRNQYNLVMENSAYKTVDQIEYPNQESRFVRAIKVGPLQLKTGITSKWTEGIYLLTPAGFMHGYKTPKHFQTNPLQPSYTVFVPHNTVVMSDQEDGAFSLRGRGRMSSSFQLRATDPRESQLWTDALLRIADQFKVVPLLESSGHGFTSSHATKYRDLPPLPDSTLPILGENSSARPLPPNKQPRQIAGSGQQQQRQQQVDPIRTNSMTSPSAVGGGGGYTNDDLHADPPLESVTEEHAEEDGSQTPVLGKQQLDPQFNSSSQPQTGLSNNQPLDNQQGGGLYQQEAVAAAAAGGGGAVGAGAFQDHTGLDNRSDYQDPPTPTTATTAPGSGFPIQDHILSKAANSEHDKLAANSTGINSSGANATAATGITGATDDESLDNWHSVHEDPSETGSIHSEGYDENEDEDIYATRQALQDAYAPIANPVTLNNTTSYDATT